VYGHFRRLDRHVKVNGQGAPAEGLDGLDRANLVQETELAFFALMMCVVDGRVLGELKSSRRRICREHPTPKKLYFEYNRYKVVLQYVVITKQ
jgi:hypothetical protein